MTVWVDGIYTNDVPEEMSLQAMRGFLSAIEELPGDTIKEKHVAYLNLARRVNAPRIVYPGNVIIR